ncbi:hypothetical protein [Singulisphaera sp. PoT]|uniref:hypothetical protein n=1 Tax=Singulisphaera sp. PoT TaxID=3411797 RepID=UPI003BF54583
MLTTTKLQEAREHARIMSLRFPKEVRRDVLFSLLTKMGFSIPHCSRCYEVPVGEVRGSVERGNQILASAIKLGRVKASDLRFSR